jgi:hypothetical protein
MITDYISILTVDEEMRAMMLQGVEHCRMMKEYICTVKVTKDCASGCRTL